MPKTVPTHSVGLVPKVTHLTGKNAPVCESVMQEGVEILCEKSLGRTCRIKLGQKF